MFGRAHILMILAVLHTACGTEVVRRYSTSDNAFSVIEPKNTSSSQALRIEFSKTIQSPSNTRYAANIELQNFKDDTGLQLSSLIGKDPKISIGSLQVQLHLSQDEQTYQPTLSAPLDASVFTSMHSGTAKLISSPDVPDMRYSNSFDLPKEMKMLNSPLNLSSCPTSSETRRIQWPVGRMGETVRLTFDEIPEGNSASNYSSCSGVFDCILNGSSTALYSTDIDNASYWMSDLRFFNAIFGKSLIDQINSQIEVGQFASKNLSLRVVRILSPQALKIGAQDIRSLSVNISTELRVPISVTYRAGCL